MNKPIKEERDLCKQVAERYRKPIREGEYIQQNYGKPEIILLTIDYIHHHLPFIDEKHWFPLWTISDCLEFFEEKGFNHDFHFKKFKNGSWGFTAENKYKKVRGEGKTKRASCLKALLTVFGEEANHDR